MKHTKKICALSVTAALSLALAAPAAAADYTVQRGDSLWKIAREQLGDGTRWGELYAANRDTVRDPSLIYAGQVLKIPGSGEGTTPSAPAEETMPAVESMTRTEKALALNRPFAAGHRDRPGAAGRELHPAQPGLRHRGGRLPGLGGVPGLRPGQDHGEQHPGL